MDIQLRQRGRSTIDFAAELGGFAGRLSGTVNERVDQMTLADNLDQRLAQVENELADYLPHIYTRRLAEWSSTHHGVITKDAFEEIRDEMEPQFEALRSGPTQIEANPDCEIPEYWVGVDFHRTTGGWVREDQGFIHGELIHPRYVAKNYPGMIFQQRAQVLGELGDRKYERIFEMGTSSGHYTLAIASTYPDASITGCDLAIPIRCSNRHSALPTNATSSGA